MEPVQYGKTSVEVDIAFANIREGPSLWNADEGFVPVALHQRPMLVTVHKRRVT